MSEAIAVTLPPYVEGDFERWAKGQPLLSPDWPDSMRYGPGEGEWDFRRGTDPAWRGGIYRRVDDPVKYKGLFGSAALCGEAAGLLDSVGIHEVTVAHRGAMWIVMFDVPKSWRPPGTRCRRGHLSGKRLTYARKKA